MREYPLVPLKNTVIFPRTRVNLTIGRDKSVRAVEEAHRAGDPVKDQFIAAAQREEGIDDPAPEDIYQTATLVEIVSYQPQPDGTIQVSVEGLRRVHIKDWVEREAYLRAAATRPAEPNPTGAQAEALVRYAINLFERYAQLNRRFTVEDVTAVTTLRAPGRLSDMLAAHVISDYRVQQELLEMADPLARLEHITVTLGNEIEILELEAKIRQRVRQQVDKNQKEYYLKEQLRAIQEELGHDMASEVHELRERVERLGLPDDVAVKIGKELDRLERMPPHSAELAVLRTYIDWILALPWQERTEDRLDMDFAQQVLDEDHYGLEKVKDRIIEFLAVRQLRILRAQREQGEQAGHDEGQAGAPAADGKAAASTSSTISSTISSSTSSTISSKSKANPALRTAKPLKPTAHRGPILCLVGPPGVGKTSLGQSIARALGRKFVRISLGGMHDEAEIRGHRRTYVGALPGRIIQAMKTAGTRNPVFLLDEIDKLTADYRGDPSAALLEVLDPEQNYTFTDHYLEIPYDLSEVFFICTGNNRYQIPRPLADRMDIVELPGYTEEEKVAIARIHLLPKVMAEHGLSPNQVRIPPNVMRYVITGYTREAGVRGLERQLATICRKAARRIVSQPDAHVRISEKNVEHYLGIPRYTPDRRNDQGQVGVAIGLAWTEHGGTLLPVEVATMPGKGGLTVTGQLGDVMQESARAALSYIRSRADELDIPANFADNLDLHIHLPEGAIPKDGPSAGITIATALISGLTRRPVRSDLAMTGEITLRGRVLGIGGLKEKVLAAHRVGIRNLLVPAENLKDLTEIPPKIRAEMRIVQVESMDQVIQEALLPPLEGDAEARARLHRAMRGEEEEELPDYPPEPLLSEVTPEPDEPASLSGLGHDVPPPPLPL